MSFDTFRCAIYLSPLCTIRTRKVKIDSILFCIGYLVLFDSIFVRLSRSYGLSELMLSFLSNIFIYFLVFFNFSITLKFTLLWSLLKILIINRLYRFTLNYIINSKLLICYYYSTMLCRNLIIFFLCICLPKLTIPFGLFKLRF